MTVRELDRWGHEKQHSYLELPRQPAATLQILHDPPAFQPLHLWPDEAIGMPGMPETRKAFARNGSVPPAPQKSDPTRLDEPLPRHRQIIAVAAHGLGAICQVRDRN